MRLGLHTSISKSLENAAIQAAEVGANTFQIFSASPRMWRASPPAPSAVQLLRRARERGCPTLNGGGMAVFQAARAFHLFTGVEPDAERMLIQFSRMTRASA